MSRVVITGLGVVSPIGNTVEEFWDNIKANKHGFELNEWFPGQTEEKNVTAKVKNFDVSEYVDKKAARRMDTLTQYAVYASKKALEDAGSDFSDLEQVLLLSRLSSRVQTTVQFPPVLPQHTLSAKHSTL